MTHFINKTLNKCRIVKLLRFYQKILMKSALRIFPEIILIKAVNKTYKLSEPSSRNNLNKAALVKFLKIEILIKIKRDVCMFFVLQLER